MTSRTVEGGVQDVRVVTRSITLSALWCPSKGAMGRGLVIALHGGGSSSGYWNCPLPGASLLTLGAGIGFDVLALDRPGYGASRSYDPARLGMDDQAELVFEAIDAWRTEQDSKGPVFLIGHSVGAILALVMGGSARGAELAAIDALGAPFRYPKTADSAQIQSLAMSGAHTPPIDDATRPGAPCCSDHRRPGTRWRSLSTGPVAAPCRSPNTAMASRRLRRGAACCRPSPRRCGLAWRSSKPCRRPAGTYCRRLRRC